MFTAKKIIAEGYGGMLKKPGGAKSGATGTRKSRDASPGFCGVLRESASHGVFSQHQGVEKLERSAWGRGAIKGLADVLFDLNIRGSGCKTLQKSLCFMQLFSGARGELNRAKQKKAALIHEKSRRAGSAGNWHKYCLLYIRY